MKAEEFRHIRKQFGWTQTECAAAIGYSARAVGGWETGARSIPRVVAIVLRLLVEREEWRAPTTPFEPAPTAAPTRSEPLRSPFDGFLR